MSLQLLFMFFGLGLKIHYKGVFLGMKQPHNLITFSIHKYKHAKIKTDCGGTDISTDVFPLVNSQM